MSERVWIALDREVAEALKAAATHAGKDAVLKASLKASEPMTKSAERWAAIVEACRKSLVTECVEVEGDVVRGRHAPDNPFLSSIFDLPPDFPEGRHTVIVIAGERDG
jgi:hypothetical protein